MLFAILTLLTAISLAAVAGWFSIVGFMTIYAGAPFYALVMGAVTEVAKLVTTSWLYRNWEYANWKLKLPLLYFTLALMTATSIGVFGFLSKAHIEQGADKIDNSSKIETLQFQIDREKALIADNEKVTAQLDATVNSFLGKERADRALAVRRSQARQRDELRKDSAAAQKRIDELSAEKFKLESEVRKLQLEVGPIRYIAEMIYGVEENSTKNIEAAVRIFTLLLVSTLDPLAVILLVAANHTLLRLKREKEEKKGLPTDEGSDELLSDGQPTTYKEEYYKRVAEDNNQSEECENSRSAHTGFSVQEMPEIPKEDSTETNKFVNEKETISDEDKNGLLHEKVQETAIGQETTNEEQTRNDKGDTSTITSEVHKKVSIDDEGLKKFFNINNIQPTNFVRSPSVTKVEKNTEEPIDSQSSIDNSIQKSSDRLSKPWAQQETVLRELLGNNAQHFIPKKINEEETNHMGPGTEKTASPDVSPISVSKEEAKEVPEERQEKSKDKNTLSKNPVKYSEEYADPSHKYPKTLGWLAEFKGHGNE